jgi:two-component system CheB/CheR fusion protein
MSSMENLIIVGIGASAGGLEALQELLKYLPKNDKIAYIVAQHLSPSHKSILAESLDKNSTLKVTEATDGMNIEANNIYITPPNKHILISDSDTIILQEPENELVAPKPSIDLFFTSLAKNKRHEAIGIILSGTGTDGTKGCARIKLEGGITIAEDPYDAKFDGMPKSAIHAGQIDVILPINKIGEEIAQVEKYISGEIALEHITTWSKDYLGQIFGLLKEAHNTDFSGYKLTTINRRIRRRMSALKISIIKEYLDLLRSDPNEVSNLYKDFLIGVTSFFRDQDSFDELGSLLAKTLTEDYSNETFRVWDIGCCSGEETYSIAILLSELMDKHRINREIKIFASDVDIEALNTARAGVYSAIDVSQMPPELLKKYFVQKNDGYKINKTIRDMIVFSSHDVLQDPPFTKLDLVACRNLLIYFIPHFALAKPFH